MAGKWVKRFEGMTNLLIKLGEVLLGAILERHDDEMGSKVNGNWGLAKRYWLGNGWAVDAG